MSGLSVGFRSAAVGYLVLLYGNLTLLYGTLQYQRYLTLCVFDKINTLSFNDGYRKRMSTILTFSALPLKDNCMLYNLQFLCQSLCGCVQYFIHIRFNLKNPLYKFPIYPGKKREFFGIYSRNLKKKLEGKKVLLKVQSNNFHYLEVT